MKGILSKPGTRLLLADVQGQAKFKASELLRITAVAEAEILAVSALSTRNAKFAAAVLRFLRLQDRKVSCGIEKRATVKLTDAPAPEPFTPPLRGCVGSSQLEWLAHGYSVQTDEHGNRELHPEDIAPIRRSVANYPKAFVADVFSGKVSPFSTKNG